ncbi:MAG: hypothetical protein M3P98_00275, partial [bacterium]|nr:hypothetical protein [bacterium]
FEQLVGMDGLVWLADNGYGGDLQKAFMNVSALGFSTKDLGWQQFHGSTAEMRHQKQFISDNFEQLVDTDGYVWLAENGYGGDMAKAFKNVSALGFSTKDLGWQAFLGSTNEYRASKLSK